MVLLVFNSCKKELYVSEKIDQEQLKKIHSYQNGAKLNTINFAEFKSRANLQALGSLKAMFLSPTAGKGKLMSVNTPETYNGFAIQTDSIKVLNADGHTSYIFPVKLASPRAVIFQNLTIDESEAGTVIFVNSYKPTKKWIADLKAGKAGKFEGEISISYLNGTELSLKTDKLNNPNGKIAATNSKLAAGGGDGCSTTRFFFQVPYNCGSGTHGPYDLGCALVGEDRAGIANIAFEVTTCGGGGGGGGGNTTPTPPNDYDPCNSAPTAPIGDDHTITETGTPITPQITPCDDDLPELQEPTREILLDSSIKNNPKIDCLLQKLLGLDGTAGNAQMKSLLAAFSNKGFDVTFKIGTTKDANSKAETSPDPNDPTKYNIILNSTKINAESQMSWVKTLLHEAFHANLMQKSYEMFGDYAVGLWAIGPKDLSLPELMDKIENLVQPTPTLAQKHHEFMAMNIGLIQNGLKSFSLANNTNYGNFDDQHYNALAYEGLNGTSYYLSRVLKDENGIDRMGTYKGNTVTLSQAFYYNSKDFQEDSVIPCN